MNNKKGIGAVVATGLLLIVAVGAVVGFQSWFQDFSSGTFSDVEQKSTQGSGNSGVETVVGSDLYFKNGYDNITISSVKIGNNDCGINGSYDSGIKTFSLGNNCTQNLSTSTPDVIITTDKGVFVKKIYLKNAVVSSSQTSTSSLDCSGLNGGEWIAVPGNEDLGTNDFCVMKYEAKGDGTTNCAGGNTDECPNSSATSPPWVLITQTNAKIECESLGANYHLITNAQWTTIARNAESLAINWDSGTVGSGTLARGWTDTGNSAVAPYTNSSCLYNTGANSCGSSGIFLYKRTLELSNGKVIWDLSGNVWEWNNDTCSQGDPWYNTGWVEWTNSNVNGPEKSLAGPFGSYTSTNGVGQYYGCRSEGNAFLRGGDWDYGAVAGAFALNLYYTPSHSDVNFGFRCSYTP